MKQLLLTLSLTAMLLACDTSKQEQPQSVVALAERIQSGLSDHFQFELVDDSTEMFEIDNLGDKISIKGSTLSSITQGLGWYLKYHCNSGTYWTIKRDSIVLPLPKVPEKIVRKTAMKHRYYMNYCVDMYNSRYWQWQRWEQEVDWMALNGANIGLLLIDRGAVVRNVIESYGVGKDKKVEDFAKVHQGVNEDQIDIRVKLQQTVIARMKELGISPMLDGYKGFVPKRLTEVVTGVDFKDGGEWSGQPKEPFIAVTDPFFEEFGTKFYEEQKRLYGDQLFIDADPIVEGSAPDGTDLSEVGVKVQNLILKTYPNATWVLQGWQGNPRAELLARTKPENTLILDLWCEVQPQWRNTPAYTTTPWVWNVLINFGGNTGMYGNLDLIFDQPTEAMTQPQGKYLHGVGAIMEGIENNPVVYNLLFESAWLDSKPNMDSWLSDYARSRYGKQNDNADTAWSILHKTLYSATKWQQGPTENIMCARPEMQIKRVSTWGDSQPYTSAAEVAPAWDAMIAASTELGSSDGFRLDLVDLTRQMMSLYAWEFYPRIIAAHKSGNKAEFEKLSTQFLEMFDDMETLLATRCEFMVGPWIETFRAWGADENQKSAFEQEAKMYITTWSHKAYSEQGELHDYAFREWAGTMKELYKVRFTKYFNELSAMSDRNTEPKIEWYDIDSNWITTPSNYTTEPVGDAIHAAKTIYERYRPQMGNATN